MVTRRNVWLDVTPSPAKATAAQLVPAGGSWTTGIVREVLDGGWLSVAIPADAPTSEAAGPSDGGVTAVGATVRVLLDAAGRIQTIETPTLIPAGATPVATGWESARLLSNPTQEEVAAEVEAVRVEVTEIAEGAQATADGKNTVWYQPTAPAGTEHKVGDTWFDIDDSNRIYRWTGTAWVATSFGTTALADDAITAAKIADGAVGTAELSSAVSTSISTAQSTAAAAQSAATSAQSTASAAQSAADAANAEALAAAGLANGKGKVIYQASAPTGANAATANLWIRTSDNRPHTYNGTSWVAVTDAVATNAASTAASAQSTAAAAQTAANTAQGTAEAAQTAAASAQSAASAAQSTANGKNKIIRSTAAASGTSGYVAGDQWWQYSGSQVTAMWLYSGSAWVAQTLTDSLITNLNAGTITAGTLSADRIAAGTITGAKIAAGTITAANLVAGTITAASGIIADAAIVNAKIADATIQSAKIASLDAAKITTGTLAADRIGAGTIGAGKLAANSVVATNLAAGAVTADKVAANAITADKLSATAIDGKTITGALIRTSVSGQRVVLDASGMRGYDYEGNESFYTDTQGFFTAEMMYAQNILLVGRQAGSNLGQTASINPNGLIFHTQASGGSPATYGGSVGDFYPTPGAASSHLNVQHPLKVHIWAPLIEMPTVYNNTASPAGTRLATVAPDGTLGTAQAATGSGTLTDAVTANGGWVDASITFPAGRFSQAPKLFANSYSARCLWRVNSVSATEASIRFYNWTSANAAAFNYDWFAIQDLG